MNTSTSSALRHYGWKTPLKVFGALTVLTWITVWVSRLHLPPAVSIMAAMSIAGIKASLVLLFFMHLRYSPKMLRLLILFVLAVLLVVFALLFSDYAFRAGLFG